MKIIMPKVVKTTFFEQLRGNGEKFYTVVVKMKKPLFSLFGRVFWYSENKTIWVDREDGFVIRYHLASNFDNRVKGKEFNSIEEAKECTRGCLDAYYEKQLRNQVIEFKKIFED